MKTSAGGRTANRLSFFFVTAIFAVAALAVPMHSMNSGLARRSAKSQPSNNSVNASSRRGAQITAAARYASLVPAIVGETIEVFAADCVTPKPPSIWVRRFVPELTESISPHRIITTWIGPGQTELPMTVLLRRIPSTSFSRFQPAILRLAYGNPISEE